MLAGFAASSAISVGIPVGDARQLVLAEQPAPALSRRVGEHPVPAPGDPHLGRARRSARRLLALLLALPVARARRPLPGTRRDHCSSAPHTSRSRCPTSSPRSRSPTPRATTSASSTAASCCSCSPRRCCSCRSPSWPCARRSARSSRLSRTPPARSASGPLGRFWRVTLPLARPGLVAAGVLVFAFVLGDLVDRPGAAAARTCTRSGPSSRRTARRVAFAAAAPFAAVLIALAMVAAYVLMSRFGRVRALEEALTMAELRCEGLAKSYGAPRRPRRRRPRRAGGDADGDPRRLGQRQDDAAAGR